jgi:signal transduction histidine kinase
VADQSAEMAAIIDDLLVAARSSFESVPTTPRTVDLASEAEAVADAIGARLNGAPLFETEPTPTFADPIRVRQIIRNLLTNADRYGGDEIRIRSSTSGASAVLQVCDNGTPISAELQQRIFEPYESSGPVRGQPAAIGLGLSVSQTLAELMGGSIRYDYDGKWSIFELQLPKDGGMRPAGQTTDRLSARA